MADGSGASKTNIWLDYSVLDGCLRADLEGQAPRAMAVLDPVQLELTNWAEIYGSDDHLEPCHAPAHPQRPELGQRQFKLARQVWIERDDFAEVPPKGFHRLFPGNKVRLKYGLVVECTGCERDAQGVVTKVLARVVPDTRSGTPGADAVKVKGTITWVSVPDALPATVNLYDRLFTEAQPEAGGRDYREVINPRSKQVVRAWLEPALAGTAREQRFQFERHGYFIADRNLHQPETPVFNRITTLRDNWTA
jgi:glutaminyl-tRNA synthetase